MSQTRAMSAIEAAANVAVGYVVACLTNASVLPAFGFQISLGQNLSIGAIFTVVSLARSYLLRRVFNRIHQKPREKML